MNKIRFARRAGTLACAIAMALGATTAHAGALADSAAPCDDQTFEQPFLRWLDIAKYTIAPGGTFEGDLSGWRLSGGAKVVEGNESFKVNDAGDHRSLLLPAGSSATTRPMCVGLDYPTVRFFAVNNGSILSTLKVDVLYEDASGATRTLPMGVITHTGSWQPTLPQVALGNLIASLPGNHGVAAYRFTPVSTLLGQGRWQIDDVYVDPLMRR